jgi:hypothetical protein
MRMAGINLATPAMSASPLDYESRGQEFESLRARHLTSSKTYVFLFLFSPF